MMATADSNPASESADRLHDRLLAEAEIRWEMLDEAGSRDRRADDEAREAGGDLEHRIITRARRHAAATLLEDALRHVNHAIGVAMFAGLVFAALAGAAAARAALLTGHADAPVNFFWALGAILGLQTLILIVWIALMIAAIRRSGAGASGTIHFASLGALLMRFAQWFTSKLHRGPHHAAAIAAFGAVYGRGTIGKWTISSISNGLWLVFNVSCLTTLVVLLSAKQVSFAWETTILSEKTYVPLTNAIGGLPRVLGFVTPSREQIAASQWTGSAMRDDPDARQAWSGLLVGALVCYGLGPRLLLLGLCLGQRRQACAAYRLDVARPEFMRLQSRLMPAAQSLGVIDEDRGSQLRDGLVALQPSQSTTRRPLGSPAVVGIEVQPPAGTGWPPAVHGVRWTDLGIVDGRDDQHRVLSRLESDATEPEALVMVCSLTTTPDRGIGAFVESLRISLSQPPLLVLTGGESLRHRGDSHALAQRIADWTTLAHDAGIQRSRVIEIDLDHLTQSSAAKLAAMIRADNAVGEHVRSIEQAFALIAKRAERWFAGIEDSSTQHRAALHAEIASLYGAQRGSWTQLLHTPTALGANLVRQVQGSADRMVTLLPERLKRSPKWLAAGAMAGALGCVAAAGFIAPVAIASLPMWSAIGAAVAAIIQPNPSKPGSGHQDAVVSAADAGEAVRAAALFAMLLEIQGRDEVTITATLDRVIGDDDAAAMDSIKSARVWLDDLRHRFDIALAAESRR